MYPRFRPHLKQRRTTRLLNFGARDARTMSAFRAIKLSEETSVTTILNLVPNLLNS
jgi:hypothetical protein